LIIRSYKRQNTLDGKALDETDYPIDRYFFVNITSKNLGNEEQRIETYYFKLYTQNDIYSLDYIKREFPNYAMQGRTNYSFTLIYILIIESFE